MGKKLTIIFTALISAIIAGGTAWCFRGVYDIYLHKDLYSKVAGIENVLNENFLYDYDSKKVADYAALGMTMALEDPYTMYYNKQEFSDYINTGSGDFVGVGIAVLWDKETDEIKVTSVMDNSPGMEAGVLPGDIITAVNGESCSGLHLNDVITQIRGLNIENPENTTVNITVKRNEQFLDLTLTRKKIHQETITYSMTDDNIGLIRISAFNRESDTGEKSTDKEFLEAFNILKERGMEKLIIDVRDNGGGDLDAVSGVIDPIVPEGLIMYSKDKYGNRDEIKSDKNELNLPMAVLVNGNTASASELLTGALKDYKKATIIGTKTYGKGVMQSIHPFSDGSGLVVTVAKYYTPSGTCVHDEGITPDIISEQPDELKDMPITSIDKDKDVQLQTAIEHLKKQN